MPSTLIDGARSMSIVPMIFQAEATLGDVCRLNLHTNPTSERGHHQREIVGLREAVADEEHTNGLTGDDWYGCGGGTGGRER